MKGDGYEEGNYGDNEEGGVELCDHGLKLRVLEAKATNKEGTSKNQQQVAQLSTKKRALDELQLTLGIGVRRFITRS